MTLDEFYMDEFHVLFSVLHEECEHINRKLWLHIADKLLVQYELDLNKISKNRTVYV